MAGPRPHAATDGFARTPLIEILVVDLGGVAARFVPERRISALATLTGLSESTVQARWFGSGLEEQAELGAFTSDEAVSRIRAVLDETVSKDELIAAWSLAFELDEVVLRWLEALPTRKALFTNNGPLLELCIAGPLQRVAEAFDPIICSWRLGARKPDARSFASAARLLGVPPDWLLLLDDSLGNIEAARSLGWHAEQITSHGDLDKVFEHFTDPPR